MFGLTTITFNGYFLGTCFAYIFGIFTTFFTQGAYSMEMLMGDICGGFIAILFTDLVATTVWNFKKSYEED